MIQDWVATQSYMQRLMLYMNNLETLRNNNYISVNKAQQQVVHVVGFKQLGAMTYYCLVMVAILGKCLLQ